MKYYIGLDCGSVSKKIACIDENKEVIGSVYLRNKNIIETVKEGLIKLKSQINDIEISGVCTTGSGKIFTSLLIGADMSKSEILAHFKATRTYYPNVRTIADIGGEDSKLILLNDGVWENYKTNNFCLKENTDITLNHFTSKPIQDIEIGERVLTHEGRFKQVTKIYKNRYNQKRMDIHLSNLRKLEITPKHPILGLKREDIKCYNSKSRNSIRICRPDRNIEYCRKYRCKKGEKMSDEQKRKIGKANSVSFRGRKLSKKTKKYMINRRRYIVKIDYKPMNKMIEKRVENKNCQHCGIFIDHAGYCSHKCSSDMLAVFTPLREEIESYKINEK